MSEERNPYYPHPEGTPAPWYVYSNELIDGTKTFWIGNSADVVFDCSPYGPKELFFPPNEPDARLICAAPDMLEALKSAIELYGKPGGPWNVPSDPGGWLDMARKAVNKAEGIGPDMVYVK
jgi:hypothetical protein